MLRLYELLPEFYRLEDERLGFPLRHFLEPLQAKLDEVYLDEKALRLVQDPDRCPAAFLPWIAKSLGWEYMSTRPEHQRVEAKEIVNFHDLKGTPYAMRLQAWLSFGPLFQRLYEFYPKAEGQVSSIRVDYDSMDHWFRWLIEGKGRFAEEGWAQRKVAERGRPYGFDPRRPYWAYCVYLKVLPDDYVRGTVRPRYLHFIHHYRRWHPAGRFCYVYITMPFFRKEHEVLGDYLIEELSGKLHWDSYWTLDEGVRYDTGEGPVHPSLSYEKVRAYKRLDEEGKAFDQGWRWDETEAGVHLMVELD